MNSPNTFVLQEVIDNLVNSHITLVDPLSKLNYFGLRTKNEELIHYTSNELNGYQNSHDLPLYRKRFGKLMVDIEDYSYRYTKELPFSMLEEPLRSGLRQLTVKEGIGTIEQFVKKIKNDDGKNSVIVHPIPMEILPHLVEPVSRLYHNVNLTGANVTSPPHIMIDIVNSIRTKLLALVMDVGDKFGFQIEIDSFNRNREINNQTINNYMRTEITNKGDGNVINNGDNSNVHATITITKGDVNQLTKTLEEYGIEQEDISKLNDILKVEQPDYENKKLGIEANSWIGNIIVKSLNGIGKIATAVTGNILATLIKSYYGIS